MIRPDFHILFSQLYLELAFQQRWGVAVSIKNKQLKILTDYRGFSTFGIKRSTKYFSGMP